jgi:hypothetical protein
VDAAAVMGAGHDFVADYAKSVSSFQRNIMADRKVYAGSRRRLVLAFDIGTTYSGISFRLVYCVSKVVFDPTVSHSILDPGQVPQIKAVTRYAFASPSSPKFVLTARQGSPPMST